MPSLIPMDDLLGAFLIGVVFSSILYGTTCLQVYSYFSRHCENDKHFLKFFVATLLVLESLQMAFLIHGFYIAAVTNFGDFISDLTAPWSLKVQSIMGIFIAGAIQYFYAWRIYQLSMGKIYVPTLIVAISTTKLALGTVYCMQSFRYPYYKQAEVQIPIAMAGLSLRVACDLIITASMVYYLCTQCTRVKRTISVTTTLVLYSITSGALTLVFSILFLVTFVRFSHTLIYAPFFFILVRLYFCAFMATLNSRDRIRTKLAEDAENGIMITISRFTFSTGPGGEGTMTHPVPSFVNQSATEPTPQKDFLEAKYESTLSSEV